MTINGVSVVDFAAVLLATGLLRAVPLVVAGSARRWRSGPVCSTSASRG